MRLVIDTTQPLTDVDRAILTTLLGRPAIHTPTSVTNVAEQVAARVQQATAKPTAAIADAKQPITRQAGVTTRESTPEDT